MAPTEAQSSTRHEQNAPFVRGDRYGDLGARDQPRWDVICQSYRALFLVPARFCGCVFWVLSMWAVSLICTYLPFLRGLLLAPGCRINGRGALFSLGVLNLQIESHDHPDASTPRLTRDEMPLVISNHSSYLDILLLSYLYAPAYLTREETRKTPFIGTICAALPCLFVKRGTQPDGAPEQSASDLVVDYLIAKHKDPASPMRPLCVFPEGTTSNGAYLLPFRSGAFRAGVPVQPVLIHYNTQSTVHPTWETISAARHLYLLLSDWWHSARIVELPLYTPGSAEQSDPKLYAQNVRQYMIDWSEKLDNMPTLKPSSSTYETKRAYLDGLRSTTEDKKTI